MTTTNAGVGGDSSSTDERIEELECALYSELARHYGTNVQPTLDPPYVLGYVIGRGDGYADGLATAIHFVTGEPIADIQDNAQIEIPARGIAQTAHVVHDQRAAERRPL